MHTTVQMWCETLPPPHLLLMIRQVGWVRLWDPALGLAYQGTPVVEQGIEPPWEG